MDGLHDIEYHLSEDPDYKRTQLHDRDQSMTSHALWEGCSHPSDIWQRVEFCHTTATDTKEEIQWCSEMVGERKKVGGSYIYCSSHPLLPFILERLSDYRVYCAR